MTNSGKGIFFASVTALMWGVLAIALKVGLHYLDSVSIVGFRFFLPFVVVIVWQVITNPNSLLLLRKPPLILLLASLFLGFNYLGFMLGVQYTTPSNAQVFIQIGPFAFAILGILLFKEKITWHHYVGFVLVTLGFLVFYSEQLKAMLKGGAEFTGGMLWTFAGGLSWAMFAILQKKLVAKHSVNAINAFIYGFCSLCYLPFFHFERLPEISIMGWLVLVFLGINTLVAYGCFALAVKYMEANKVSVIITLNPLITFALMSLLSSMQVSWIAPENFTLLSLIGAGAVFSGAIIVILFRERKTSPSKEK